MKKTIALLLAMVMIFAMAACGKKTEAPAEPAAETPANTQAEGVADDVIMLDKKYTFRYGHTSSATDANNMVAEYFAEELNRRTNGMVEVEIYPSGLIGSKSEMFGYILDGSLDFQGATTDVVSQWLPSWKICDLPYLVSNYDEADAFLDGPVGDALCEQLKDIGAVGLGWGENGFREMYNNKRPVTCVGDMEGLKIRAMETSISVDSFKSWNADPTVMTWTEVYSGLQQGTVDGADGPEPLFKNAQMQEVVNYMSTTHHFYTTMCIVMSKQVFDTLPAELQDLILEVGAEAAAWHRETNRNMVAEATAAMVDGGLEVYEMNDEERAGFAEASRGVYTSNREAIGAEFFDWAMNELGIIVK